VFAVDDDEQSLERIRRELTSRYGTDYRVVCERSAGSALQVLEEMRGRDEAVALVLAAQWMEEIRGVELLAMVGELHPLAKRALLIDWGGWGHRPTADAIFAGIAQRHMDYYVMRPRRPPDEQFHRTVSEFLQEWDRTRSQPSGGEVVLVAHRPSRRGYELREVLTRNGIPHVFRTSDSAEGARILRDCGVAGSDLPVALMHDGRTLVDPSSTDLLAAFGVQTEIGSDRTFDVIVVGAGPAGLTAAVYASSEGLSTLVVERQAIGGQAGSAATAGAIAIRRHPASARAAAAITKTPPASTAIAAPGGAFHSTDSQSPATPSAATSRTVAICHPGMRRIHRRVVAAGTTSSAAASNAPAAVRTATAPRATSPSSARSGSSAGTPNDRAPSGSKPVASQLRPSRRFATTTTTLSAPPKMRSRGSRIKRLPKRSVSMFEPE
jgi:hypothetical protein